MLSETDFTVLMKAIDRIHERIDALVSKESVASSDCETRRNTCRACMQTKIEKARGYPTWVTIIGSIGASLIVGMSMYIITHAGG